MRGWRNLSACEMRQAFLTPLRQERSVNTATRRLPLPIRTRATQHTTRRIHAIRDHGLTNFVVRQVCFLIGQSRGNWSFQRWRLHVVRLKRHTQSPFCARARCSPVLASRECSQRPSLLPPPPSVGRGQIYIKPLPEMDNLHTITGQTLRRMIWPKSIVPPPAPGHTTPLPIYFIQREIRRQIQCGKGVFEPGIDASSVGIIASALPVNQWMPENVFSGKDMRPFDWCNAVDAVSLGCVRSYLPAEATGCCVPIQTHSVSVH